MNQELKDVLDYIRLNQEVPRQLGFTSIAHYPKERNLLVEIIVPGWRGDFNELYLSSFNITTSAENGLRYILALAADVDASINRQIQYRTLERYLISEPSNGNFEETNFRLYYFDETSGTYNPNGLIYGFRHNRFFAKKVEE